MFRTRKVELTTTTPTDVITPPKNRAVEVYVLRLYNSGTSDTTVTLTQIDPDGNSRDLAVIPVDAGQEKVDMLNVPVIALDRGCKLQATLSTATTVEMSITYTLR